MIRLVLDNLTKRFDDLAVVDAASIDARPGELVIVLGPPSAGKSTLARLIAGLERPDAGEIYFNGRVMNSVSPSERRVGMVFQDEALWPHLTVADHVAIGLRNDGGTRRERRKRIDEVLDRTRLDTLANKRPDALTEVQQRRVALARAMACGPDLLLLDEPLEPLPARARDDFRDELRRWIAEAESTALIFTRDPRLALAMADRVAVIDLGRIVQFGTPSEVYNQPVDAVTAQLLGPVNLLQGQVDGADTRGDLIVRTPLGRLLGRGVVPMTIGALVTVAIRPEALSLGHQSSLDANRFAATVERQLFLGDVRRLFLRGPGDWPVTAVCLQVGSQSVREGQSLTISVAPDHVVVMPGRFANVRPPF